VAVARGRALAVQANNTARQPGHPKRIFTNLNGDFVMSQVKEEDMKFYQDHMKHWRSWGSWFSWGSPVGLGLFLLAIGGFIWLLSQAFGWN
jgi:hypothetical protein